MSKPNLVKKFVEFEKRIPYQDNSGVYNREEIISDLKKLERLDPLSVEYWLVRTNMIQSIAKNGFDAQFARGKYEAGMLTMRHFTNLTRILDDFEEPLLEARGLVSS